MGLPFRTRVKSFDLNTVDMASSAGYADNKNLCGVCVIPANREIEIRAMKGYVIAAAGASTFVELVQEDDTVICKLKVSATGTVTGAYLTNGTTAATFPIRVAAISSAQSLKLKVDQALDATTEATIEVHFSEPGV